MYADRLTDSMQRAIDETSRRRTLQEEFNQQHGIVPEGIHKAVRDITDRIRQVAEPQAAYQTRRDLSRVDLARAIKELELEMKEAAKRLEFEKAAQLRNELVELRKLQVSQQEVERRSRGEKTHAAPR